MIGCGINKWLLRNKRFPTFRAFCGTTIVPIFQNGRHKTNPGFQCLPFSTTSGGNQSDQQEPPPFEISTELPPVLQQQCQNWMRALRAEQKAVDAKQKWANCTLKCTKVLTTTNTSELTMSMDELTREGKQVFMSYFRLASPVLLRPFVKSPWQEDIFGILQRHLFDPRGLLSASTIYVKRRFNRDEQDQLKNTLFDIKPAPGTKIEEFFEWLKRNKEWARMPGFDAMLYSFKCKPWPNIQQIADDSTDWIGEEEKHSLDPSQLAALCAVQNLDRPIVAVHGPPGTGKTMLLVRHLQQLKKQGKSALVLSPSISTLYNLISTYQQTTNDANYLILKGFNKQLADRIVADPNIRQNMERRSVLIKDLPHPMNGKVVFLTPSRALINALMKRRITFDVLIVEEANGMNEFETWWMALPMAPIIHLFGNPHGLQMPISSEEARELALNKSLLQRLDEEFGPEVNFHLQRQYRSAPVIQEWPARAFYGQRAVEADKSVQNIHLKDLLVPDAKLITDPLVLVDLNKLEGEWRNTMFEPELAGFSFYSFGEALLVAEHLRKLFANIQQDETAQIAYFTQYEAQRIEIRHIFECFFPAQLKHLEKVRLNQFEMGGQSCEVVLQSFVSAERAHTLLSEQHHLKTLAFEMTRARRQYMLFAKSEWLEEGSDESRQLLQTFRNYGKIIGPNNLLRLGQHTQIFDVKLKIMNMVRKYQFADYRRRHPKEYK